MFVRLGLGDAAGILMRPKERFNLSTHLLVVVAFSIEKRDPLGSGHLSSPKK
jgi:hypothetical protein